MGRKPIKISSKVEDILQKFLDGPSLKREDITHLLRTDHRSMDASFIRSAANAITRSASKGKAEVHAQIGPNLSPCPNNCSFCSFAAKNGVFRESQELPVEDIILLALKAEANGANALFS
jgi:biotin synthase